MKNSEIVVIGGGVVGASVAYHLAERGAGDVVILEAATTQGSGSTGKATGGIRAQFETEINIRMSLYSLQFFKDWEFDCSYEPRGYLFFATTPGQLEYLERNVEKQRSLGVAGVDIVDPAMVAEIVPGINGSDIVGGSFGQNDGFIDPIAVMRGFTQGAIEQGANIEFGTRAVSIVIEGEKVVAVETDRGTIACEAVVICTGARAADLAATAGIDLPVIPQRRQIVWARSERTLPPGLPMVIDIGTGFHFRPARAWNAGISGRRSAVDGARDIMFAFPEPDDQPSSDDAFDPSCIPRAYDMAGHRAPFLLETEVISELCRAGLYENTPDHHAILGGCDVGGLYFACGFSGHGVMHSPATGRALAEIILDGKAGFLDVSCLDLNRFTTGDLLHETAFI